MMRPATVLTVVLAAALTLLLGGCGGEPESEVDKLVGELVSERGEYNVAIAEKLGTHGEEAIAALLKATQESPEHLQYCYSHVLTGINAEPARFEACKKLLEHPNIEVCKDAAEGLAKVGAPDEAVRLAIQLAGEAENPAIRSIALYAISSRKDRKFANEICRALRRATTDPEQDVREHAQRGLDRFGCR